MCAEMTGKSNIDNDLDENRKSSHQMNSYF